MNFTKEKKLATELALKVGQFLKQNFDKSKELAELIQQIEQLRPSHVYGKGKNGETAKICEELFNKIKEICDSILKNER